MTPITARDLRDWLNSLPPEFDDAPILTGAPGRVECAQGAGTSAAKVDDGRLRVMPLEEAEDHVEQYGGEVIERVLYIGFVTPRLHDNILTPNTPTETTP